MNDNEIHVFNIDNKIFIGKYSDIYKPLKYKNKVYDKYIVDICGNVYNSKNHIKRSTRIMDNGYVLVRLTLKKNHTTWYLLHRIVAYTFIDNPYNLPEVDHIDNNKQNNSVSNLNWVTDHENKVRAVNTGAFHSGFNHYESKFTKETLKELWDKLLYTDISFKELSKMYNVTPSVIRSIYLGEIYKEEYLLYEPLKPLPQNDKRFNKKISREDILKARELYNSGISANKLHKEMGIQPYLIIRQNDEYYAKLYDNV